MHIFGSCSAKGIEKTAFPIEIGLGLTSYPSCDIFVEALGVGTEELLRPKKKAPLPDDQPSPKLLRRMKQIESLPVYEQRALLTTIDKFLAAAQDG